MCMARAYLLDHTVSLPAPAPPSPPPPPPPPPLFFLVATGSSPLQRTLRPRGPCSPSSPLPSAARRLLFGSDSASSSGVRLKRRGCSSSCCCCRRRSSRRSSSSGSCWVLPGPCRCSWNGSCDRGRVLQGYCSGKQCCGGCERQRCGVVRCCEIISHCCVSSRRRGNHGG